MTMFPPSFALPLVAILGFSSLAYAASPLYGSLVAPYKDNSPKEQLNMFQGDQFLINFKLKTSNIEQYNDIASLNVTQTVSGINSNVTIGFTRAEKNLYNVTSVSPSNNINGRNATVVSRSNSNPIKYFTAVTVKNSDNATLSLQNIVRITLASYRIVTNPGVRIDIIV